MDLYLALSRKLLPYFLGKLSNEMQSTSHKALTNTIKKIIQKVVTNWTFILLWHNLGSTELFWFIHNICAYKYYWIVCMHPLGQSRIKVHFVATFLNNFLIVFVSVLWNVDCISFDNLPKKYRNSFWLKMYQLTQNVAKFRSKCEKYKMDFCPELVAPNFHACVDIKVPVRKVPVRKVPVRKVRACACRCAWRIKPCPHCHGNGSVHEKDKHFNNLFEYNFDRFLKYIIFVKD